MAADFGGHLSLLCLTLSLKPNLGGEIHQLTNSSIIYYSFFFCFDYFSSLCFSLIAGLLFMILFEN